MRIPLFKTLAIAFVWIIAIVAMRNTVAINVTPDQPNAQQPAPSTQGASNSLTMEIASPEHFHRRVIAIDQPFLVVVTNTSQHPMRVWRDWCSWGYQQLSFEITDDGGHTWTVTRKEHEFFKNYPDFWTLDPAEPLVLSMTLTSDQWESKRDGIAGAEAAITTLRGKAVTMRAIFAAEEDDQSRNNKVWSGRLTSAARRYELE